MMQNLTIPEVSELSYALNNKNMLFGQRARVEQNSKCEKKVSRKICMNQNLAQFPIMARIRIKLHNSDCETHNINNKSSIECVLIQISKTMSFCDKAFCWNMKIMSQIFFLFST